MVGVFPRANARSREGAAEGGCYHGVRSSISPGLSAKSLRNNNAASYPRRNSIQAPPGSRVLCLSLKDQVNCWKLLSSLGLYCISVCVGKRYGQAPKLWRLRRLAGNAPIIFPVRVWQPSSFNVQVLASRVTKAQNSEVANTINAIITNCTANYISSSN